MCLQEAVTIIDKLNITAQNHDVQGDIYEYLLSELRTAGKNAQFRTPRHIIRMIVSLVDPKIREKICDPACGTGGFLIAAYEHILATNTSEDIIEYDLHGVPHNLVGDKIVEKAHWNLLRCDTFYGFEIEYTMIRIALMNMILHGIERPNTKYADSLSKNFDQKDDYDILLANPPFTGSIDETSINDNFQLQTNKTESLFLELFINILHKGGKGGVIVPTGLLSGQNNAHRQIRQKLLKNCQLEAVVYMPSGMFKPYAGVETSFLIFTKGGSTDKIWFYDMNSDGYSLDDKREFIDGKGDIPDIIEKFKGKVESGQSMLVDVKEIENNDYILLSKQYRKITHETVHFEDSKKILDDVLRLEKEISNELKEIRSVIQ